MKVTTNQLKEWFNEFNKLYFNNSLPMVSFTTNSRCTKRLGQYSPMRQNIDITNTYDREEKWYKETLIHEMVHHYTWIKYKYCGHSRYFTGMANFLNSRYGWHIQTYAHLKKDENITPIRRTNNKPSHKLLALKNKDRMLVCFIREDFSNESLRWYRKHYDFTIYDISYDPIELSGLPICRSRLTGRYFKVDDVRYNNIMKATIN